MWAQVVGVTTGVWLMAAPAVLGYTDTSAADVDRIIGPVSASAALIAVWEATRGTRLVNVVLGSILLVSPLVAHHAAAAVNAILCGMAIAASASFGGPTRNLTGGGWRSLWQHRPPGAGRKGATRNDR